MTYQEFKKAVIDISRELQVADYELYYTESESTSVDTFRQEVNEYSTDSRRGVTYRCVRAGNAR